MKRPLLSLCLVGAVFSGHTPNLLQPQSPPASTEVEARAVLQIPDSSRLVPTSMPGPQYSGVEHVAGSLAMMRQDTPTTPPLRDGQIWNPPAPLPNTEESSVEPAPEGKNEETIWVAVIRGATVHSGPSVSAPTVRFYPVGTELNLIGYEQGWFQVSDPTTSQRGWIYEKYYLEAIRGPGQARAVMQNSPSLTRAALKVPKPRPPLRRVKKPEHQQHQKLQPRVVASARVQNESVASLLTKAFRGF